MIELSEFITAKTVEKAYARAVREHEARSDRLATVGLRAARARDPKLLLVLDKAANVLDAMSESQMGRTRRSTEVEGLKVEHTEVQLWKNAYKVCDKGLDTPDLYPYCHVFGAAALLAGFAD